MRPFFLGQTSQKWIVLAALSVGQIAWESQANAQLIYGADGPGGGPSHLYVINPSNGAVMTTVGPILENGNAVSLSAMDFDPISGNLYGVAHTATGSDLVRINTGTAVATLIGSLGISSHIPDIDFAPNGTLFGFAKTTIESLVTINLTTGAATVVGATGLSGSQGDGLASSPSGTLYFAGSGASGALQTISTVNGSLSTVATLNGAPVTGVGGNIKAMDFLGTTLYAIDGSSGAHLVTINTSSGLVTDLGAFGATTSGLEAMAFAPVPEPSAWTLVAGVCCLTLVLYRKHTSTGPRMGFVPRGS